MSVLCVVPQKTGDPVRLSRHKYNVIYSPLCTMCSLGALY